MKNDVKTNGDMLLSDLRNLYYEVHPTDADPTRKDMKVYAGNELFDAYEECLTTDINFNVGMMTPDGGYKFKGWIIYRNGNLKPNEIVVYKEVKRKEL